MMENIINQLLDLYLSTHSFLHNNDSKKSYLKYEFILSINNVKGKHIKLCIYLYLLNN